MMGLGIIWPLIPVYAVELGAGGFLVGLIVASFNISRTLLSPFSGSISDKWGRKRFIASGLLIYAVLSVFYVLPENAETLILIRLLHGIASLLVVPVAMALTADIAPPQKLGLYMGTLNMAIMIGLGFGPAMGGIIRDTLGFNAAFYMMGGLALITSLMVAIFIPADNAHLGHIKRPKPYPVRKIIAHRTARRDPYHALFCRFRPGIRLYISAHFGHEDQSIQFTGRHHFDHEHLFDCLSPTDKRQTCRPDQSQVPDHRRHLCLRHNGPGYPLC